MNVLTRQSGHTALWRGYYLNNKLASIEWGADMQREKRLGDLKTDLADSMAELT